MNSSNVGHAVWASHFHTSSVSKVQKNSEVLSAFSNCLSILWAMAEDYMSLIKPCSIKWDEIQIMWLWPIQFWTDFLFGRATLWSMQSLMLIMLKLIQNWVSCSRVWRAGLDVHVRGKCTPYKKQGWFPSIQVFKGRHFCWTHSHSIWMIGATSYTLWNTSKIQTSVYLLVQAKQA